MYNMWKKGNQTNEGSSKASLWTDQVQNLWCILQNKRWHPPVFHDCNENLLMANSEIWEDDIDDDDNTVKGEENVLGMEGDDDVGVTKKKVKKSIYYFTAFV